MIRGDDDQRFPGMFPIEFVGQADGAIEFQKIVDDGRHVR